VFHNKNFNSNYGSGDYAWGERVYGWKLSSSNGAIDFIQKFCGTSSAAAIIAGVAISVQSIMEANYNYAWSTKCANFKQ
jgi:hypothetical protein